MSRDRDDDGTDAEGLQVTPAELWLIKRSLRRLIVNDGNQWLVNRAQELLNRLIPT